MRSGWLIGVIALASVLAGPGMTQDTVEDRVEDIVVTARRAQVPIWTVTRGESTVILVGSISGVPRDFAWRTEALEAATARSQRILYPQVGQGSLADVARVMWRMRTISSLPDGTTTADYLTPELQARLEALMAGQGDGWRTRSFFALSLELLEKAGRQRRGHTVVDAVQRVARRARIPGEPVGIVRGDELVEGLISDPPSVYVPCIAAAIGAAEVGAAGAVERLEAWRSLRVADVLATPLDQAVHQCWPTGDPEVAPLLRTQWRDATQAALAQPGVTMGVSPLRILAEPGGVLDQLEAAGLEVVGPDWKVAGEP